MKEKPQTYICKLCNKETNHKKIYLDGHCATCKLLRLKMSYTANKLEALNKFECHQQIKSLRKKESLETDESDLSDNISEDDNHEKDPDFVLLSVSPKKTKMSLVKKHEVLKRPVPFPDRSSFKTPTPKSKKSSGKKHVQTKTKQTQPQIEQIEHIEKDACDKDASDNESDAPKKIPFTIKRDWEGQVNYFPANEEHFEMYYPEMLADNKKPIWHRLVQERKEQISEELTKLFGSPNNVMKVHYSNRFRMRFPCPVEGCGFKTVDLKKHLLCKHKWTEQESKLQVNYFNVMTDFVTRLNNLQIHRPTLCFKCSLFFDRVDHHLVRKHFDRGFEEYRETLNAYKQNTQKVLISANIDEQKIQNVKDLLKCIDEINKKKSTSSSNIDKDESQPVSKQASQENPQPSRATGKPSTSANDNQQPGPSTDQQSSSATTDNQQPGPSRQKSFLRGTYVPAKTSKKPLLKYKKELTTTLRKRFMIPGKSIFRYYYDSALKVIEDFKVYKEDASTNPVRTSKQQIENVATMANNIKQVWREIDVDLSIFPRNFLSDADMIEDNFYRPHLKELIRNLNLPKEQQTAHIQASTIKSKLCSLSVFCRFLITRRIYINITFNALTRIIAKIQELNLSLKQYISQREQLISKYKSETLIITEQFQKYGNSKHVKDINELLYLLEHSSKTVIINKQKAIEVRDYLMVSLTYFNCLRASNLMTITIEDVRKIIPHNEIDGAHVLKNDKYKTSMLYGAKIILLSETHLQQIKLYIQNLRPFITNDYKKHASQRFLFTSSRFSTDKPLGQQIDHSAIANAMAASFRKAKVLSF